MLNMAKPKCIDEILKPFNTEIVRKVLVAWRKV
jgi:hypothetical protein